MSVNRWMDKQIGYIHVCELVAQLCPTLCDSSMSMEFPR